MLTRQPKKMMILYILDILRKYTDADHRLSQREIEDILRTEYNMPADRKSVRRNLMNLIDSGYNIEYSESVRMVPNAKTGELEESYILSDFYLSREFTDGELRLLIDSLLFSQHIPYSQCRELVKKLEGLSNNYFRSRVQYIDRLPGDASDNKQLFLNIELLDEAISKGRKVAFEYLAYGTDKQLHPPGPLRRQHRLCGQSLSDGGKRGKILSDLQFRQVRRHFQLPHGPHPQHPHSERAGKAL